MELDIIKLQTTWNDAAGSLNNNFAKIQQAINTGSGGGGSVAGGGIYEIKYDFINGNPLSEEDIAFNAEVFDKLSRNEVSALYVVIDDEGYEIRLVADSFYYIPIDKDGHAEWVLLNFTTKSLDFVGLPQRAIRIGLEGSVVEFPFSGSGISFVRLSRPDEITTFYDNNTDDSLLSTLIVDDIDGAVNSLWGRIVDFGSGYITYSCSNGDVRRVTFNSDYTIKKRGLIEGVIYLGDNLTDFQKQANLAYATAMKDLNDYDYSNGNKKRVGVVVYYNGDFYNALIFNKSGIVILVGGSELQEWIIDEAGNTTLGVSINIGGADIDTSKFATTAQLQELDNILSDEIDGLKDSKQDTISDLETIRSGAALGATALQEHQDISGKQDTLVSGTNIKTINGESILGEGNLTIQGGNGSYDDTEIRNELSRKADVDGVYPEMTVGMTRDMLGVGEGDEGEFLFRPTDGDGSIKDGFASIERIDGNSVVWNQLLKNDLDTLVLNGVTFTNNGDGSFLVNGTATANIWYPCVNVPFSVSKNHKYLLYGCPKGGSSDTYCLYEYNGYLTNDIGSGSITQVNADSLRPFIVIGRGFTANNLVFRPRVVDLTKMFGAGYEPLTLEEFYQRIPNGVDLNAYNEGEVVNMNVEGIKSVGFNAWDEQWEKGNILMTDGSDYIDSQTNDIRSKNFCKCLPNMAYYVKSDAAKYAIIYWYNLERVYLGCHLAYQTQEIATSPSNAAYFRIGTANQYGTTYNNDICINLVHTGYRNGEYEPYVSDEIAFPIADYFPNGMNSIGDVKDELTATEAIQRIGVVDMGELSWAVYESGKSIFQSEYLIGKAQYPQYNSIPAELVCARYVTKKWYDGGNGDGIYQTENGIGLEQAGMLYVADTAYTDPTSFKTAMSGVMLYYELAEPIVTKFDKPLALDYQVWDFGTEEAIAEGKTTPLKASIIYEFNARDTIRANKLALKNKADKTYVDNAIAQAITLTLNTEV